MTLRMIKDSPTGERGRIEDFHLITHTNTRLPPPLPLLPVMNHTSFCVSGGQNGERPSPPSVRLPGGIIQGTPSISRERHRRDIAGGVKGKRVERIRR